MMKKLLLFLGIALAAIGCTKSEIEESTSSADGGIRFSAGVTSATVSDLSTRVSATDDLSWAADGSDKIGLYTDQAADTQNMQFSVDKDGNMTSDTKLYADATRTYYAYHPYMDESGDITVNSSDYSVPLLYATTTTGDANVKLQFKHVLAKVTFNLTAGGGDITDLTDAAVTLKGANSEAVFSIESGTFNNDATTSDITFEIEAGEITAYLIPMESVAGNVTLEITVDDKTFTTTITTEKWEGGKWYEYNVTVGTSDIELKDDDIYYINSANGLKAFADLVNGVENTTAITKGFEFSSNPTADTDIKGQLNADIDLSSICGDGVGSWTPIGKNASQFAGTFDGDGHTVSGLYINATSQQGLFGYITADGKVYNLGVSGDVTGYHDDGASQAAGLAANNYGFIINCYSEVNVTGQTNVGGIVAYNEGNVVNCYNRGEIDGTINIGGIVGQNAEGGYVGYCYNTGELPAVDATNSARVGGVVGWNHSTTDEAPTVKGSFCLNTTTYSIGLNDYNLATGGLDGNVCTEDYLKSESFATTINNGSALYNSENTPPVVACSWNAVDNDNYPTLSFGTTATSKALDISYNSISYNIYTELGLQAFAALVNGSDMPTGAATSGSDMYFDFGTAHSDIDAILTTDIESTSGSSISIGAEDNPYSGTFDFNDNTISGITINFQR